MKIMFGIFVIFRYGHPVSVDLIQEIVTSSHIRADLDDFIDEVHRRHAAENNANDQVFLAQYYLYMYIYIHH